LHSTKTNTISSNETVAQKKPSFGSKSLPSAPVTQMFAPQEVKQLKSSSLFPPIQFDNGSRARSNAVSLPEGDSLISRPRRNAISLEEDKSPLGGDLSNGHGGEYGGQKYVTKPAGTFNPMKHKKGEDPLLTYASDGIEKKEALGISGPIVKTLPSVFHTTTNKYAGNSINASIDPSFHNPASRFGGGFYVATDKTTSFMEVEAHENDLKKDDPLADLLKAVEILEFKPKVSGAQISDFTATPLLSGFVKEKPIEVEKQIRKESMDGLLFKSTKGPGNNLVLFKNENAILGKSKRGPKIVVAEYEKFKESAKFKDLKDKQKPKAAADSSATGEKPDFKNKSTPGSKIDRHSDEAGSATL
jgi:hypothetical protein